MAKPTGDFWFWCGMALFALGVGGCTMMVKHGEARLIEARTGADCTKAIETLTERVEALEAAPEDD